jgi:hypothetical protein
MRVNEQEGKRIVGHVTVKIASQVVSVPVEAAPFDDPGLKAGFFSDGTGGFGILVDSRTPATKQREVIEAATVEAARYLSRRFLN